jgi:branched-subunit amino acid transport protein
MNLWWTVLLAGAGTLALRLSFLLAARYVRLPRRTGRITDLVFPVAMGAILGASLRGAASGGELTDLVALAAGAVATAVVSRRTGSVLAALLSGLAVVALIAALVG